MNDSGPAHLPKRHIIANNNDSLHFISMGIDMKLFRLRPSGRPAQKMRIAERQAKNIAGDQ